MKKRKLQFDDAISEEFKGGATEEYLYWSEETGELCAIKMPMGEMMERQEAGGFIIFPDGTVGKRALPSEFERDGVTTRLKSGLVTRARWPQVSVNGGVNPNQRQELRDFWKEHKVTGCEVLSNGDIVHEDRAARKADMAARGLYDRDGGYGDQMPQNL